MFVRHTALTPGVGVVVGSPSFSHAATPRTLVTKVERVSDGDTVSAVTSN
jgi:hypothetical protein